MNNIELTKIIMWSIAIVLNIILMLKMTIDDIRHKRYKQGIKYHMGMYFVFIGLIIIFKILII